MWFQSTTAIYIYTTTDSDTRHKTQRTGKQPKEKKRKQLHRHDSFFLFPAHPGFIHIIHSFTFIIYILSLFHAFFPFLTNHSTCWLFPRRKPMTNHFR